MRHRRRAKRLNRDTAHRKALRMNLISALLEHGQIKTTLAKAKFVRGDAERVITIAKRGLVKASDKPEAGIHARRMAARRLNNNRVLVQKLFDEIAPLYEDRSGGYTRIYKLGPRKGDNAEMALLQLVDYDLD